MKRGAQGWERAGGGLLPVRCSAACAHSVDAQRTRPLSPKRHWTASQWQPACRWAAAWLFFPAKPMCPPARPPAQPARPPAPPCMHFMCPHVPACACLSAMQQKKHKLPYFSCVHHFQPTCMDLMCPPPGPSMAPTRACGTRMMRMQVDRISRMPAGIGGGISGRGRGAFSGGLGTGLAMGSYWAQDGRRP